MLSDYPDIDTSDESYETLKQQLAELAAHAEGIFVEQDEDTLSTSVSHLTSDFDKTDTSESSSGSAGSRFPHLPESVNFVKTAFPRIPEKEIRRILKENDPIDASSQIDMDQVMVDLLSFEHAKDLEDRGLEGTDYDSINGLPAYVENSDVASNAPSIKQKKSGKRRTLRINDIRQQHQVDPVAQRKKGNQKQSKVRGAIALDPWVQTESLSQFFSNLIPGSKPTRFQSYLHNPDYANPSTAIRAAIASLDLSPSKTKDDEIQTLIDFLEFLHSTHDYYDDLTLEEREQLIKDSELALRVCKGPETALELVSRLVELDIDAISGMSQGLYHSRVRAPPITHLPVPTTLTKAALGPLQEIQPPKDPPLIRSPLESLTGEWISIPIKPQKLEHPLAHSIPAYARRTTGFNSHRDHFLYNKQQALQRRNELLQQASHYWRQGQKLGGSKSTGGNIAYFYADRARKLAEESKAWNLESVKANIEASRFQSQRNVIDLHGLTIEEALAVVQDVLDQNEDGCSQDRPLKVITGAGRHSPNKVGVLLPAILKQLTHDGWDVRKFEAGIVVSGKSATRQIVK